jgi:hypothetical protein
MIRTALAAAAAVTALALPAAAAHAAPSVKPYEIDGTCWIGDPEGNVDVPVIYVLGKRVTPDHPICN